MSNSSSSGSVGQTSELDLLSELRVLIKDHKRASKKRDGKRRSHKDGGDGESPEDGAETAPTSSLSTFDVVMNGLDKEVNFVERLVREAEAQSPDYVSLVRSNQGVDALLAFIKYSMQKEITRTESLGVLFRADSNCTNLMKVYARMVGLSYLYQTLEPLINRVWLHPDNFEIENNLLPKKTLKRNLEKLTATVQLFIDTIVASIEYCPPAIRELCREMRKAAEKKWEDASSDPSFIGGFLFLRLFCPAIVSPVKYQLIPVELAQKQPEVQKTLLVITKALQKAANNSTFAKGQHLACLNPVILANQDSIANFLYDISLPEGARRDRKQP